MKILFVSNLYPPNVVGGYERLCFDVAEAMVQRGHQVSVLTSSYGQEIEEFPKQHIERSLQLLADHNDIYRPFNVSSQQLEKIIIHNNRTVERKIINENPDLVFVWNLFFLNSSFIEAIEKSRCKLFFLLTDNWLISFLNPDFWHHYFTHNVLSYPSWKNKLKSSFLKLYRAKNKSTIRLRGKAIFPSLFMQNLYADAGFRFEDQTVIPHGVRLASRRVQEYADRSALLESGKLHLLFAGRVVEIKGVHTLLKSLPRIIGAMPQLDIRLSILGDSRDSGYENKLTKLMDTEHVKDRVAFYPPVAENELFSVFQRHDLYLFPSLYEPFSLTLIHALHSGIPTIASDTGGNREIVRHKVTGLLFPPENCRQLILSVKELAESSELRNKISITARKVAAEYTFDKMIKRIDKYLEAGL